MTTDGTFGTAATLIGPDPSFVAINYLVGVTGGSWAWPTWAAATIIGVPNVAAIRSQFNTIRAVAFGVKATASQSFSTAQGRVHVCLVSVDSLATTASELPTSVAQMKVMPGYNFAPLADLIQGQIYGLGRSTSNASERYRSPLSVWMGATSTWNVGNYGENEAGWFYLLFAIESATTSTTAVDLDIIIHYEGISLPSATVYADTPAAPYQPVIMSAVDNITSAIPAGRVIDDAGVQQEGFWGKLEGVWDTALKIGQGIGSAVDWFDSIAGWFA
jgi:hypothetical protein